MAREYVALFGSIRHSTKLAALPSHRERWFYTCVLAQCDAWGRIDARPMVLLAECWPISGETIASTLECRDWLVRVGLVELHRDAEGEWLQLPDWEEKAGSVGKRDHRRESRWPDPSDATRIEEPRANAGQSGPTRASEGQDGTSKASPGRPSRARVSSQSQSPLSLRERESEGEGPADAKPETPPAGAAQEPAGSSPPDPAPPAESPPRRKRTARPAATRADLEALLDEPEFLALRRDPEFPAFWPTWLDYREEIGHRYKSLLGGREALREAVTRGAGQWIADARRSMANGWQGCIAQDGAKAANGSPPGRPHVPNHVKATMASVANMFALSAAQAREATA